MSDVDLDAVEARYNAIAAYAVPEAMQAGPLPDDVIWRTAELLRDAAADVPVLVAELRQSRAGLAEARRLMAVDFDRARKAEDDLAAEAERLRAALALQAESVEAAANLLPCGHDQVIEDAMNRAADEIERLRSWVDHLLVAEDIVREERNEARSERDRYRAEWEEAARHALRWQAEYDTAQQEIERLRSWVDGAKDAAGVLVHERDELRAAQADTDVIYDYCDVVLVDVPVGDGS